MPFLNKPPISLMGNDIILGANLTYYDPRSRATYVVPRGFTCDGASIPKAFWSALGLHPFSYKIRRPAILHDFLYRNLVGNGVTRKQADQIFFDALVIDGHVISWKAQLIWQAVRIFGRFAIKERNKNAIST